MLKPNNQWTWFYDAEGQQLMLDLGADMMFKTAIPANRLIPDATRRIPFSVEDATLFQTYSDMVHHLPLTAPRRAELVLNAIAAHRYHKPMLPKSWFFTACGDIDAPELGEVVVLETEHGQGHFIVVENSGNASLVMSASLEPVSLDGNKMLNFCDTIKVMNDRMQIAYFDEMKHQYAKVS
ncbi:cell division protein ZapC [Thaumasiovibrio subtropicus]|uniref:cell division protein ZapC n=1 Tax=Thaumasiovibrio subtropicus TaxID=1891207 RepID=UPI000B352F18|nr:cell division protein ZapC [Thaumasiovibrio subtropicus]